MLKTALKIEQKKTFFEIDPQKIGYYCGKKKVKFLWAKNFKDFAISLTVYELWQFY